MGDLLAGGGTSLNDLRPGEACRVTGIEGDGPVRRRLLDMGVTPGRAVEVVRSAPLRDPIEIRVGETFMTLRRREASRVAVERSIGGDVL